MKLKNIFYEKTATNISIFIVFLLLLLTILFILSNTVYAELLNRISFQESALYISRIKF